MASVLISGTNRGIGLELCRQYHARGDDVIAVCREASDALSAVGVRVVDGIDVASDSDVDNLHAVVDDASLDILINNAGILRSDTLETVDFDSMLEQYRINTVGPLRLTRALTAKLRDGAKVGIVTSRVGSIDDNSSGGNYGYRASKAAANMVGMNLSHDLAPREIAVALLHPGFVATDMTGGRGVSAVDAAMGLIARMDELTLADSGSFWHAEGYRLPW